MTPLSVEEARARIVGAAPSPCTEIVSLRAAHRRVLGETVIADRDHPPLDIAAMDGYGWRHADVPPDGGTIRLKVKGVSRAGGGLIDRVGVGEAVRIFTGAAVPAGVDRIVIQENCVVDGDYVSFASAWDCGEDYIRRRGMDFVAEQTMLEAGRFLTARDIALLAALDHACVTVRRRPRIGILSTGDELRLPGMASRSPDHFIVSNAVAIAALVERYGGEAVDLGIARDRVDDLVLRARSARDCDVLVILGGASVGDYDLVRPALMSDGLVLDFHGIAMRPGSPLMFGRWRGMRVLGLPGNPVSGLVCAQVFLIPLISALLLTAPPQFLADAILGAALPANDRRQSYLRARLHRDILGQLTVLPFAAQDSFMTARLAMADCLIIRAPHVSAALAGEIVTIMMLDNV